MAKIMEWLSSHPWAILPEWMETLAAISERQNDVEAVEKKLGKPLNHTEMVMVRDGVAIVPLTGPIFRYANMFTRISGATSVEVLATDFEKALQNPDIKAIVLNMDSPGGQVNGIAEMAGQIYEARQKKPVIAYCSDLTCSAAYWLASAASEIVTSSTARVGSIGTVVSYMLDKTTNTRQIVSSQSPKKNLAPDTDEGLAAIQATIDSLTEVFVQDVAAYRSVNREKVLNDFGQGGVFVGIEAVNAGLADRVGTLEGILTELKTGQKTKKFSNTPVERTAHMDWTTITAADIQSNRPDLVMALTLEADKKATAQGFEEGKKAGLHEGKALGATSERERIQGVMNAGLPGHDELIKTLAFDGETSPGDAALAVNKAERETSASVLEAIKTKSPKPVDNAPEPDAAHAANTPEAFKAEWQKSAQLQKEFGDAEAYVCYRENGGK